MSSPPRTAISPKRNSAGKHRQPPRRSTTMPSMPRSPRLSVSGVVSPRRLSKVIGDMNKFLDDTSNSATSFLSDSFGMNLSLSNHSNGAGGSGRFGGQSTRRRRSHGITRSSNTAQRRMCPTEICLVDFDDFVGNRLPEFVEDKDLVARLYHGVQTYLPNQKSCCPISLSEIEHYLTTILESTSSLPGPVVADLQSYRGLIYLKQGGHANVAAAESFTRALWLQSNMLRLAVDEQDEVDLLVDLALTEHRLGVAYGRNQQYLEAIDQMKYAIQSYERAKVSITEACYVSAKEYLHEVTEARQLSLLKNSGRALRRSQLRRCKSSGPVEPAPLRRTKSDSQARGARRPRRPESSHHQEEKENDSTNVPVEVEVEIEVEISESFQDMSESFKCE